MNISVEKSEMLFGMTVEEAIEIVTNAVQREDMTAEQDKALSIVQKVVAEWCDLNKPIKLATSLKRSSI